MYLVNAPIIPSRSYIKLYSIVFPFAVSLSQLDSCLYYESIAFISFAYANIDIIPASGKLLVFYPLLHGHFAQSNSLLIKQVSDS